MALDLSKPFSWKTATGDMKTLLQGLQPNILKPHTREFLTALFVKFDSAAAGRKLLKDLGTGPSPLVKSALVHLQEVAAFNDGKRAGLANPPSGTAYVGVGLTHSGYAMLTIVAGKRPADAAFRGGMQNAQLGDPAPAQWEAHFRDSIHAIILVGDSTSSTRDAVLKKVRKLIDSAGGAHELANDTGHGQHNSNGNGIEHFGYVDGRSQPLFFQEDIEHERFECDGTANWDPAFAPSRAIVPDPAAPDPSKQFGSYFVYRKLEQNVRRFKTEELSFATRVGLKGEDRERAGAMIVGRFEDGTPLTSQHAEGAHNPVQNNFNYDSDPDGGKCPYFGHIRKMNPRGSGGFETHASERLHIMPRRGQTYGVRTDDLNDGKRFNKPTRDVGLLFMAFNANLAEQFEFVQKNWANFTGFPKAPQPPGVDLVIGHGNRPSVPCIAKWGGRNGDEKLVSPLPQTVTMKGGEYFFMPSLAFLASL